MSAAATTVVVPMPHMGVSVDEGTVVEWLKSVGDEVSAEEAICIVATDKVDTEIVAPADGVLAKQLVGVDESVAVGHPLAEMSVGEEVGGGVGGDSPDATPRDSEAVSAGGEGASRSVSGEPPPTPPASSGGNGSRAALGTVAGDKGDGSSKPDLGLAERAAAGRDEFGRFDPKAAAASVLSFAGRGTRQPGEASPRAERPASPVARRMAAEAGVDLGAVEGSGRGGRIRKADVEAAIANGGAPPAAAHPPRAASPAGPGDSPSGELPRGYEDVPHEIVAASRVRRAIAEHMVRSRRTAAHMTTEVDVDLSALVRARRQLNESRVAAGAMKLSYLPLIARAACAALGEHPELNASFLGERIVHWRPVNLGVAVDTPQGLMVPVIRECDRLTAPAIGDAVAFLAERARCRELQPDELTGGTFTISNPGSVGAVSAPAIINQPQVAILGVPAIQRRPWVVTDANGEESIAIRPILRLAVTFDHRALDGADATRFAVTLKAQLETWSPEAYT